MILRVVPCLCAARSMLFVRFEIKDWQQAPDLTDGTERFEATAIFEDGSSVTRTATMRYKAGERERILTEVLAGHDGEPTRWALRRADAIRRTRWSKKQAVLGALQREYAGGLK